MFMTKTKIETKTKTKTTSEQWILNLTMTLFSMTNICELAASAIADNPDFYSSNLTQASAKKRAVHEQIMKEYLAK